MRPSDKTYYHGTFSQRAVDALRDGDGLVPMRPRGQARFAAAVSGLSYLSPSFRQAADYAMMHERADWPDDYDFPTTERSYIFAFDLTGVDTAIPEEDELGWAVMHAVKARSGIRNRQWTQNLEFADAFAAAPHAMAALAAEADARLARSAKLRALLRDPAANWSSAMQTAAGRSLAKAIDPAIGQALLDMGISIGVAASPRAIGAWSFDRRKIQGFMDTPEKADPEPGLWPSVQHSRPSP